MTTFVISSNSVARYRRQNRKRRIIDYNAEIPFEKQPPVGFFDTSEDVMEDGGPNFKRLRREDVEGVRRDAEEAVSKHMTTTHKHTHTYHKDPLLHVHLRSQETL